jgi:TatD DNase family protein
MTCLVDTHAHLYSRQFDLDRHLAVERAIEQGVKQIFLPNVDNESLPRLYDLAANYPQHCFATIGLHPCSVKDDFEQLLEKMAQDLTQPPLPYMALGKQV